MSAEQQRAASIFDINLRTMMVTLLAGMFTASILAPAVQAQTFQVLHSFTGYGDGSVPEAGVTMDRAGNFYGTTFQGTVFKLSHLGSGWVLTTLYTFRGGSDGPTRIESSLRFRRHFVRDNQRRRGQRMGHGLQPETTSYGL